MAEKYITEEQRAGCRKVADAFAELYDLTDVVVADAGRFGFVRLQWFSEGEGFDSAMVFSDGGELFPLKTSYNGADKSGFEEDKNGIYKG